MLQNKDGGSDSFLEMWWTPNTGLSCRLQWQLWVLQPCDTTLTCMGRAGSKPSQHIGGKCSYNGLGLWFLFQIWIRFGIFRISLGFFCNCLSFFSYGYRMVHNISGKSGTSVRYQSFGCSVSGHLENICTDRRSQKFLWLNEFLPPSSVAFGLLPLPPHHHSAPESFLGNVCLGSSQNQIQSWDCCVDTLQEAMNTLNNYLTISEILLDMVKLSTQLCKGCNSLYKD